MKDLESLMVLTIAAASNVFASSSVEAVQLFFVQDLSSSAVELSAPRLPLQNNTTVAVGSVSSAFAFVLSVEEGSAQC